MTTEERSLIGIDLGTYNSVAAAVIGRQPLILRPEEGPSPQGMCFPSVVEFDEKGDLVNVGLYALRSLPVYPQTVVIAVKRLIGKAFNLAKAAGDVSRFGYTIVKDTDGGCALQIGQREHTPTQVTALILEKIKHDAEADFNPLGRSMNEAVITVPAYFDALQKVETERAGLAAGFQRVSLMPESTAAASAYRLEVEQEDQYIMVIDLGAGTLDVTVALLFLDDNGQLQTEEMGHGGDTALGGLDMDDAILEHVVHKHHLRKILSDARARARLRLELERAKIELSSRDGSDVVFPTSREEINFRVTRQEVESAVQPILERCRGPIRVALEEAGVSADELSHVLLVGGPTMMPVVRHMVLEEMESNPKVVQELSEIDTRGFPVNPMEAVARGAVMGAVGRIMPHGYGVMWFDGEYVEMFPRHARYPDDGTMSFGLNRTCRSVEFNLVRHAINPQTRREEYMLLGTYSFDLCAEQRGSKFQMEWECTENGSLTFCIVQPSTGIHLPLYDVTKLEGEKIRPPDRRPRLCAPANAPDCEGPMATWRPHEMEQAIYLGRRLLELAEERVVGLPGAPQRERIDEVMEHLSHAIGNSSEDNNRRAPRIRNLNQALMNLLRVKRLLTNHELGSLQSGDQ